MSGLVDRWTSELAKLRNKGKDIFTGGPAPASQADPPAAAAADEGNVGAVWRPTRLAQTLQVKKLPAWRCSEASLSMLVDNCSA